MPKNCPPDTSMQRVTLPDAKRKPKVSQQRCIQGSDVASDCWLVQSFEFLLYGFDVYWRTYTWNSNGCYIT